MMRVFTKDLSLSKLVEEHSPRGREGSYDEVDELVLCLLNVPIVIMKQNQ